MQNCTKKGLHDPDNHNLRRKQTGGPKAFQLSWDATQTKEKSEQGH